MRNKGMIWVLGLSLSFLLASFGPYAFAKDKSPQKEKTPAASKDQSKEKATDAQKDQKNEKAAVVNGTVITQDELKSEMGRYERQMAQGGQAPDENKLKEMKMMVLQGLIDRELLRQETQKLGIKVDDAEVNEQIVSLKKRFGNEAEFTSTLSRMNLTEVQLKTQFAQDMAVRKMIDQQITSKVAVSAEETKGFYDGHPEVFKTPEKVRASHILVKVDQKATDGDKAKAREKIAEVQKKVRSGEDFAALAKSSSDCPSAANGGDLDYFQRGQMVGPFEQAAFAMKPGEVSDIVETEFGYHLIKLTDKKEAGVVPYEEIKEKIEQHLKQERTNQQLTKYIDQLKSTAKIETFVN